MSCWILFHGLPSAFKNTFNDWHVKEQWAWLVYGVWNLYLPSFESEAAPWVPCHSLTRHRSPWGQACLYFPSPGGSCSHPSALWLALSLAPSPAGAHLPDWSGVGMFCASATLTVFTGLWNLLSLPWMCWNPLRLSSAWAWVCSASLPGCPRHFLSKHLLSHITSLMKSLKILSSVVEIWGCLQGKWGSY